MPDGAAREALPPLSNPRADGTDAEAAPPPDVPLACPACASVGGHAAIELREMMFGTREAFEYRVCSTCGSAWQPRPPTDLAPYYPARYFAAGEAHSAPGSAATRALRRRSVSPILWGRRRRLSGIAERIAGVPEQTDLYARLLRQWGIRSFQNRILDVGCGLVPARLCALRQLGFEHLRGVDAYVPRSTVHHGIHVDRRDASEIAGSYDVVMYHHSFEHLRDPRGALHATIRLLRPGGRILIRTPIMGSWFWREYGLDWWELDAPRHLVIFSAKGLTRLAHDVGLEVVHAYRDSSAIEFIGSEQYRRDLAMYEPGSWFVDQDPAVVSPEDMQAFGERARVLNAEGDGGRGGFLLRPR
jgi:2-polyprenyl-3-methyl-5-hydroxy-6-metoxy-1,4-benzoquinol methylase